MLARLGITWVFNTVALFVATWLLSGLSYGKEWWALHAAFGKPRELAREQA